ncbi:MAG: hypothetical protein WBB74_03230 [Gaiellaceae bacterium]
MVLCTGLVLLTAATSATMAKAGPGSYVIDGGTRFERRQVTRALAASTFDWTLVPTKVTIHVQRTALGADAAPGEIWVDPRLLRAGEFSWGIVQHEYAHQIDFFLLDDSIRARLLQILGGTAWCYGEAGLPHGAYGCERFASTLAWAYWPSRENCMRPAEVGSETSSMRPARFRRLLGSLLSR